MPASHAQLYIHAVFAVDAGFNFILPAFRKELYQYIAGIFRDGGHALIEIGGMPDHIHLLFRMKSTGALSDLIRDVKAHSSRHINGSGLINGRFYWQQGYGAFSCSHSHVDAIIASIRNQRAYHQTKTFKDEYLELFGELNIDFKTTVRLDSGFLTSSPPNANLNIPD